MQISRVQVEEGFLDGLDLEFKPGLNVIIGARGTGKTSLIELLRFVLGGESFTPAAGKTSLEHALAVLGSGQVKVTLSRDGSPWLLSKSASDQSSAELREPPLIFSQTEIESLGLHSSGRLKLLDGFIDHADKGLDEADEIVTVKSLTRDILARQEETEAYIQELAAKPALEAELASLVPQEEAVSRASEEAASKNEALQSISERLTKLGVAKDDCLRLSQSLLRREHLLFSALESWGEDAPRGTKSDVFDAAIGSAAEAKHEVYLASTKLREAGEAVATLSGQIDAKSRELEQEARELRRSIDQITEGAGKIANEAQSLRSRIARLVSLEAVLIERQRAIEVVREKRDQALDRLAAIREKRFEERQGVADYLNSALGPRISVEVEQSGLTDPYAAVLANLLRGTGLHYNELSRTIAAAVSPRELAEYAENNDGQSFAAAAGIPRDRAEKCLASFREASGREQLFTLAVEDRVDFFLLDQSTHKPISELSTGQRCTVVLPIVLERRKRMLIVDQPEDHIDNAFIAETLIKAIADRSIEDQVILTTHNANIPVLGDAAQVIQMGSDGKRGFAEVSGPLDDPAIVDAITSIMEGGREAFEQRATFYAQHP